MELVNQGITQGRGKCILLEKSAMQKTQKMQKIQKCIKSVYR